MPVLISTDAETGKTRVSRINGHVHSIPGKERDAALEQKVVNWISSVIDERPTTDYEHFIQDGSVLARVMTSIVFNSVPLEEIGCDWGSNPGISRIRAVIREIKRYGVTESFEVEDLLERRNIPKVTKCLAQLSKLAASDKDNLLNTNY